jgi:hypothetical protein
MNSSMISLVWSVEPAISDDDLSRLESLAEQVFKQLPDRSLFVERRDDDADFERVRG